MRDRRTIAGIVLDYFEDVLVDYCLVTVPAINVEGARPGEKQIPGLAVLSASAFTSL